MERAKQSPAAAVSEGSSRGSLTRHSTGRPRHHPPGIANRSSGLLLGVETNAPVVITQRWAEGDHRSRQWQLLPV
jgi:hypothetical protein